MPPQNKAFTYLFGGEPRTYPFKRHDSKCIQIALPRHAEIEGLYPLCFDERDQRALVIFDGDIPWNGLPRAGAVIFSHYIGDVSQSLRHFRNHRDFEEEMPPNMEVVGTEIVLKLYRHFLLLPGGRALVR